ncbi:MAG: sulfate ABC transporter permease subunit [bacterium]
MAKAQPEHRQNPIVKYLLIGLVILYLAWLLGLPIVTLVQHAVAIGKTQILRELWHADVAHAFLLTALLSAGAVAFNGIFGTLLAYVMVRQRFAGRAWINGLLDLPFAVSPVVVGYMFILLFGKQGWLHGVAAWTGIPWIFSWPGMLLATLFVTFPFVVREVMPLLEEIGIDQEEAAHTLGAGGWTTFWRITLPGIKWGLLYGVSLTLARALGEFGAVLVVGAGVSGSTETGTIYVYRAMEERMYGGAYAASLLLIGASFLLLVGMEIFKKRTQV